MFTWLCMVSLIDIFAACQTVGSEDEEEVGPPPSPGYSYSCVPVWHESSRTGWGNNIKQDSFLPLSNSQVRTHLQNCMGLVQAYPNYTNQHLPCKVKFCAYTLYFSLQDTSWRFWCWWVARNNWSNESCSCSCTSTTKVPKNASMDGVLPNTYWDPVHL